MAVNRNHMVYIMFQSHSIIINSTIIVMVVAAADLISVLLNTVDTLVGFV